MSDFSPAALSLSDFVRGSFYDVFISGKGFNNAPEDGFLPKTVNVPTMELSEFSPSEFPQQFYVPEQFNYTDLTLELYDRGEGIADMAEKALQLVRDECIGIPTYEQDAHTVKILQYTTAGVIFKEFICKGFLYSYENTLDSDSVEALVYNLQFKINSVNEDNTGWKYYGLA